MTIIHTDITEGQKCTLLLPKTLYLMLITSFSQELELLHLFPGETSAKLLYLLMYLDLSVSPAGKNKYSKECVQTCIFKSKSYAKLWVKRIGFAIWCNFVHICTSKGLNRENLTHLLINFLINQP